ncbi:MAG: DUF4231 domain-containing protein [Agathobacter sp.]|nr:DUF4231 domain-containing protein [Agathobacter sp.]MBQ3512344.1 DUF4231 domain-containing protein [Lachnospiraceae bacterium]MBQ3559175.1 DUF4231 domain-containing protein [Agathobacter sp.]
MKNTKETNDYLSGLTPSFSQNPICKARTIYCLNWYSKNACLYKFIYYALSIINIIVPLLSSLIISFAPAQDKLVAVLSAIASFCASLLSLWGAKDKWTNYRSVAEFIKMHYALYLSQAEPYNTPNSDSLYLNTIEQKMQNTHSHWENTQNNKDDDSEEA